MKSLHLLVEQASKLFETHQFKKSLHTYQQAITLSKQSTQPSISFIHNLISIKATILSILGNHTQALDCLKQVLKADPYHLPSLQRRVHIFKKKNKLKNALKDIRILECFLPDNLQIAALKLQIQNLKRKSKNVQSSEEDSQEDSSSSASLNEEQKLNFCNLRMIDRKSVSIMLKPSNARKSRVTIGGDTAFEYQFEKDQENVQQEKNNEKMNKNYSNQNQNDKKVLKEKYIQTFREIELDQKQQPLQTQIVKKIPNIKVNNTGRTKSILKNRQSKLYVNQNNKLEKQQKYGGRESKMINLLKDIDGKLIQGTSSMRSSQSIKQVQFRKSIFNGQSPLLSVTTSVEPPNQKKKVRKSCLKRCSIVDGAINSEQKGEPRRSKFERLSKIGIDGIVLKGSKNSIDKDQESNKNQTLDSGSDSDQGSQHNIFGNHKIVISKQIRQQLGLGEQGQQRAKRTKQVRAGGGKSILKKHSVITKIDMNRKSTLADKVGKKPKKSVMFGQMSPGQ